MVMKQAWAWRGVFLLLASVMGSVASAAEPVRAAAPSFLGGFIIESRVLYPLRIGDWEAEGERRYDDPSHGVSIRYKDPGHAGRWMDVFFYPAGVLSEDQVREVARGTLRELESLPLIAGSGYTRVQSAKLRRLKFAGDPPRRAYSAALQMDGPAVSRRSGLGLMLKDLYLVKIRYSASAADLRASTMERQLRTVLQALDTRSSVTSTGDCWSPLPIVERPALDPKADGVMMRQETNGALEAVVFADRVEVLRADADAARLMSLMGASMVGRIVPSCVPEEEINPEVADDMREIRLEYPRARAVAEPGNAGDSPP